MIKIEINKSKINIEVSGTIIESLTELGALKNELETNEEISHLWKLASQMESEFQNAKNNISN